MLSYAFSALYIDFVSAYVLRKHVWREYSCREPNPICGYTVRLATAMGEMLISQKVAVRAYYPAVNHVPLSCLTTFHHNTRPRTVSHYLICTCSKRQNREISPDMHSASIYGDCAHQEDVVSGNNLNTAVSIAWPSHAIKSTDLSLYKPRVLWPGK
jgi:hypothetical protein